MLVWLIEGGRMCRIWRELRKERGTALAGLALALPLYLTLVLGVLDLGRGYMTYVTMSNAAREGARWISVYPTDLSGGIQRVEQEINTLGINPGTYRIIVTPNKSQYQQNEIVEVKVEYDYDLLFGFVPNADMVQFQVSAFMRVLYEPTTEIL